MDFSTRPSRPPQRWPALVSLLAAAALALLAGLEARAALRERAAARGLLEQQRAELAASRRRLAALESRGRGAGDSLAARARLTLQAPPHRVLSDLAALLPPDVRLDKLSLVYGDELSVEVQLLARRPSAYDALVDRVVASPRFVEVIPSPESRDGELRASLRMSYRPEPLR